MNKEERTLKKEKAHLITLVLLALYLSLLENLIPKPFPWMKLGLANLSLIIAIKNFGPKMGFRVFILRVIIQALVMGTIATPGFIVSVVAGLVSTIIMIILFKYRNIFSTVAISSISAVAHNIIQLVTVYYLIFRDINLYSKSIFIFIFIFMITGWLSGAILGIILVKFENNKISFDKKLEERK